MKYKLELILNKPRTHVWQVFTDQNKIAEWQPTLINIEHHNGQPGQPGAVTRFTYKSGNREFSLLETITQRVELERLEGVYENEFANNFVKNTFSDHETGTTRLVVEVEFKFKTWLMKLVGPFSKKRFVANTQRDMDRFKALVDSQ